MTPASLPTRRWLVVVGGLFLSAAQAHLATTTADRPAAAAPAAADTAADVGDFKVWLPLLARDLRRDELRVLYPTPATPTPTRTSPPASPAPSDTPIVLPTATRPTVTATPTNEPMATDTPVPDTPTPTSVPKPTPPSECRELVVNGGFESGAQDWDLYTNAGARYDRLARVIRDPPDNELVQPRGGQWMAALGGGTGGWTDEITNPDPASARGWLLPNSEQVVSATLKFYFAIATNEQPNRVADDRFTVAFVNDDKSDRAEVLPIPLSEESTEQGRWRAFSFDVTRFLTQRNRWDRARLVFKSENSQDNATWHHVDDVSITLCTKPAAADDR